MGVVGSLGMWALRAAVLLWALKSAYEIRLYAIKDYGLVIHEFDPWFNFRATQYLADNGLAKFFTWFDYESWYPLGRPVGTTIYPGMQMTSVAIWTVLNNYAGIPMSLNDVCCYVPCWFGVLATLLLCLLTYECSRSANAAVIAAAIMAIIPAHIMRSVGGGYDNESVAMTAICGTFWLWCLALRSDRTCIPVGILAGLSYIYMVAAWGGYIFVINMIGAHAGLLVLLGRHSSKLHRAYTLFYIVGTLGAMQIPVVGWAPLKSLEQLGALGVFGLLQIMEFCNWYKATNKPDMSDKELMLLRAQTMAAAGAGVAVLGALLLPSGYFGPLSSRIRGLLVKHTRTGNPLVDSVAEHQPASAQAYWQYLHFVYYLAPWGLLAMFHKITDTKLFLVLYAVVAYYFSSKMVRLVLLLGPIGSALGGVALALIAEWLAGEATLLLKEFGLELEEEPSEEEQQLSGAEAAAAELLAEEEEEKPAAKKPAAAKAAIKTSSAAKKAAINKSMRKRKETGRGGAKGGARDPLAAITHDLKVTFSQVYEHPQSQLLRKVAALFVLYTGATSGVTFSAYCQQMAEAMSGPSIMYKATLQNGEQIILDDYREAYWWLRDNTPQDARVMAWWDYGYQISGIGNRTTIADGNTWNHEHIATLGKCLTSPEQKAHKLLRHLADYVLVWTGGGGDDIAKSPHMARICNSVYDDHCPGDPTCSRFQVSKSLLHTLTYHNQQPGIKINPKLFREVKMTKYNKVRIFQVLKVAKKSKAWAADPANRKCDAPGSWYCEGQYPPDFAKLISKAGRRAFKQLEDFNVKGTKKDDEYQREYMRRMNGEGGGGGSGEGEPAAVGEGEAEAKKPKRRRRKAA